MKKDYQIILLEKIKAQNDILLEGQDRLRDLPSKVDQLQVDMTEVKIDIKTIKAALKDTNVQVHDHQQRITKLEAAKS